MEGMESSAQAILEGLDDAQSAAATTLDGPVRIVAGAGAGKTRTVTRRIAYACATKTWNPSRVLAVTFSVKAAAEMRSRLAGLGIGDDVNAATFHSAALHQLRRVWNDICEAPFPHISRDPRDLVARSLKRVTAATHIDDAIIRDLHAEINWAKISLIAPADYARVYAAGYRKPPAGLEIGQFMDIYQAYEQEKTSRGEIDFDDILLMTCHVLNEFEDAAAVIRSSIGWLTVDEYQDVSPLQHRLLTLWLGDNRNVCVVGDPAQTIYSFAGASSYDLLNFPNEFAPVSADISLNRDYRSTPQVIACANRVLAKAPNRDDYLKLEAVRENGAKITRTVYGSDMEEAQGVAQRIARLIADGVSPSDCAVLTRINAQQAVICQALRAQNIRFRVKRDTGWENSALADDAQMKQAMLETLGVGPAGTALQGVTITTIHASKGLEFKHVFLIGCSEGLLPYGSPQGGELLEEERRLMYVGITRAEDSLHLSYARSKDGMGGIQRSPSRFLN